MPTKKYLSPLLGQSCNISLRIIAYLHLNAYIVDYSYLEQNQLFTQLNLCVKWI